MSGILANRKAAHINICCDEGLPVEGASTFFEHVHFLHHSLPEIDYANISCETHFLGYTLRAPFMISCMTGGSQEGYKLNKILATAAQEEGIAVGTGSLRILLHKPEVIEHFRLKEHAADVPVLGNIGAVQLPELFADGERLLKHFFGIIGDLGMDALVVHLNPGQEIFQHDGNRNFSGLLHYISLLCERSPLPIIVKETGAGIAPHEAEDLFRAGVRYVDIAGAGGTNWMAVEAFREQDRNEQHAGGTSPPELEGFEHWGIPSALALSAAISRCGDIVPENGGFIASGGLRSASDFAKAIALGADIAATALPLIRLAKKRGLEGCTAYIRELKVALKRTMLLSASENIDSMHRAPLLFSNGFLQRSKELEDLSQRAWERRQKRQQEGTAGSAGHDGSGTQQQPPLGDRKFSRYSIHKRREIMQYSRLFKADELEASGHSPRLLDCADTMVESAVGFMPVPLGIVRGILIDGKKYHLPLAVEEPSVIAAATYASGLIALHGGFVTQADEAIMNACVYLSIEQKNASTEDIRKLRSRIQNSEAEIQELLSATLESMTKRGGGYRGLGTAWLPESHALRVDLRIDVCDAMGANLINTVAERVSPFLEKISGGEKLVAILSNQSERRLASATFTIPLSALHRKPGQKAFTGQELGERIVALYRIADEDPSRAVTHNKGIMNGVSSLALATANDTRAIEAAAHAWAARSGRYRSLSQYHIKDDTLQGTLELPLAMGTVGGAVSCHPVAQFSLDILDRPNARGLARQAVALGLAQNFAALFALAGEGIQQGHMKLHGRRRAWRHGGSSYGGNSRGGNSRGGGSAE